MKACYDCGATQVAAGDFCTGCGGHMAYVIFRTDDDMFLDVPEARRHTREHTGTLATGKHAVCGGCVDGNPTTSGKVALTCRKCNLRVVTYSIYNKETPIYMDLETANG